MTPWVRRLFREDDGQDLVEYAVLAALVAVAAGATLSALANALGASYSGWDTAIQNLWIMPDPGGS